jgi:single-stranded-DNA-specific exonuclease
VDILASTNDLLDRFGRHPMAVGIGLAADKIDTFKTAFENCVKSQLNSADLEEFIAYDGEVVISDFSGRFFELLDQLAPFGHGMPKPVFRLNEVEITRSSPVGQKHLRGTFKDRSNAVMDFIAFSADMTKFQGRFFDVLATPQLNTYGGNSTPQLCVIDIKPVY